ncbi:DoxX family protein [Nocardia sp. NPDC020380]|uniref:DoxX family protein n=1 Tax=Nocardia sp. NPDC020380 TaxID=3364309 RepID=UPI0037A6FE19
MYVAFIVVTAITIAANVFEAVANLVRAKFVRQNIGAMGLPESMLPFLGVCKGAGALGLIAGLAGWRPLGIAAAAGLTLFFVLAVAFHIRKRVLFNIAFPLAFLGFAIASLGLVIAH